MIYPPLSRRLPRNGGLLCLGLLAGIGFAPPSGGAAAPPEADAGRPVLSLDSAIRWALEHNPEMAALRQQHGIAAAGVVVARTYPFNPVWETRVQAASGPE